MINHTFAMVALVLCPACALTDLSPLADLGQMPVACGLTFPDAAQARRSTSGHMVLAACQRCGHVANTAFDPALAEFDPAFEAALFHSPTYTSYAKGVVERLVQAYDLAGRHVLEVASGSHVLTEHLTRLGCVATGIADPAPADGHYDLVLARFVVEHMADPAALLTRLRQVADRAFIEIPDAGYDLTTAGWDCIYPHVGYFGADSLEALCARTGWRVVAMGTAFHDQYLWAEVEAGQPLASAPHPVPRIDLNFESATSHWQRSLDGRRSVVWGAGTRGTMFCNRVDPGAASIIGVVDRNPGKQGRFLPITGHPVIAPADLAALRPDVVVLTNPAYRDEIVAELAGLGLAPEVVVA